MEQRDLLARLNGLSILEMTKEVHGLEASVYRGFIGIMEKNMETTFFNRIYIGAI